MAKGGTAALCSSLLLRLFNVSFFVKVYFILSQNTMTDGCLALLKILLMISSLIIYSFTIPLCQRWSSSRQSVHLQYLSEGFSERRWGKSVRRLVEAASHILLWLFVFYWGLITSKVQFQRQPMIHLQVPLSESLPHPLSQLHLHWSWETLRDVVLAKSKKKGPSCLGKKVVGMTL